MVIGHNDIGALLLRITHLFGVGNPAVHRDDEIGHELVKNLVERGDAHAITLTAFGDIEIWLDTVFFQCPRKNCQCADSVGVIVAKQRDPPILRLGTPEQFHCLLHSLHQEGRKKMLRTRMKERAHFVRRDHSARIENARRRLRNAERRGTLSHLRLLGGGKFKFMHEFLHGLFRFFSDK